MADTRTRRLATLLVAGLLAVGLATPASAQTPDELTRDLSAACPSGEVPRGGFDDVGDGTFGLAIDCLAWYGITRGVGDGTSYDQDDEVTRGQMANFLLRLIEYSLGQDALPDYDGDSTFSDVPSGSSQAAAINILASSETEELLGRPIIVGFGDGRYGPGEPVRRDQMGTFMARTLEGLIEALGGEISDRGFCRFTDDDIAGVHRDNVSLVCAFGIASGRADGSYGPLQDVTRGQMAAFLMRLQDNLADDPFEVPTPGGA